jgi:hypothetical protein
MTKVRVFVLLGGLVGPDGSLFSRGMIDLARRINQFPNTECTYHYWTSYKSVQAKLKALPEETITAVVGYSGGGSRLSWISAPVDLGVGYDPSPASEIYSVKNYNRVLCYHNQLPNYLFGFRLGGGFYLGKHVEVTEISMNHMMVQYAEELHARTLKAISSVI